MRWGLSTSSRRWGGRRATGGSLRRRGPGARAAGTTSPRRGDLEMQVGAGGLPGVARLPEVLAWRHGRSGRHAPRVRSRAAARRRTAGRRRWPCPSWPTPSWVQPVPTRAVRRRGGGDQGGPHDAPRGEWPDATRRGACGAWRQVVPDGRRADGFSACRRVRGSPRVGTARTRLPPSITCACQPGRRTGTRRPVEGPCLSVGWPRGSGSPRRRRGCSCPPGGRPR